MARGNVHEGRAVTWLSSLSSQFNENNGPLLLLNQETGTGSAPADANCPPKTWTVAGDGSTDINGDGSAPPKGSMRCDAFRSIAFTLELFVASGSGSVTVRPYFFDGVRWAKCGDSIVFASSQTASGPAARERHDIVIENDYGFLLAIEAISGTGAKASAWAKVTAPLLGTH